MDILLAPGLRPVHPVLYDLLEDACAIIHPQHYLEIGTREGDSLLAVLRAAPTLTHITICDQWGTDAGGSGRGSHLHILQLLDDLGYKHDIEFLDGDSHHLLPQLPRSGFFDLILVDGDHTAQGARQDLNDSWPLLRPGGLLVFDDTHHPAHSYLLPVFRDFVHDSDALIIAERSDQSSGTAVIQKQAPNGRE